MDPMKRFVEERKKTIQVEIAKLHQEYEAVVAYLDTIMQKADADCQELLRESNCECFRKKCVPLLNWLQEKYDNLLLMRSLCLHSSESECQTESLQNLPLPDGNAEKSGEIPEDTDGDEISVCKSLSPSLPSLPSSLPLPLTCIPTSVNADSILPDSRAASVPKSYCSSSSGSLLSESLTKPKMCSAIPKYEIKEITMKVTLSCITSPWLFWVQIQSHGCELEDLLEGLTAYNSKLKRDDPDYKLTSKPHAGQIVAALYKEDNMWYRAYVLAVFQIPVKPGKYKVEVDVVYVDYGNSERLPLNYIRPIPERFLKLPFCAFVCSLTQVAPVETHGILSWPKDVLESFSLLDCNRVTTIRFSRPISNCPLMFIDFLDFQPSNSPMTASKSMPPTFTEAMIANKQAVLMPSNDHAAKWYWENYSHITQTACPGEKIISNLTKQDFLLTVMPVIDKKLFASLNTHDSNNAFILPSADQSLALHNGLLSERQVPCARPKNTSSVLVQQIDSCQKLASQMASVNISQSSFPTTHVSLKDQTSSAVEERLVSCGGQALCSDKLNRPNLMSSISLGNQLGSLSNSLVAENAFSSDFSYRPIVSHVASDVATVSLPGKVAMKSDNANKFSVTHAAILMNNLFPNEGNTESKCHGDHLGRVSENVDNVSLAVPSEVSLSHLDSGTVRSSAKVNNKNKFHSRDLPAASCSLQEQKLLETRAYVNRLAESGWPEKIAQAALVRTDDSLLSEDWFASSQQQPTAQLQLRNQPLGTSHSASDLAKEAPLPDVDDYDEHLKISSATSRVSEKPVKFTRTKLLEDKMQNDRCGMEMSSTFPNSSNSAWSEDISRVPLVSQQSVLESHSGKTKSSNTGEQISLTAGQLVAPTENCIDFVMSFIESPSKFWIHLVDSSAANIDYIENEIRKYFIDVKPDSYSKYDLLQTDTIVRDYGLCCARSAIDGKIYRAELVDVCVKQASDVKLEIVYIDFGNSEWITLECFFTMPPHLVRIPPLAICCTLDGVEPIISPDGRSSWSSDAVEVFTDMCGFTKVLIGKLSNDVKVGDIINHSRDCPLRLQLVDSNSDRPVAINEQLIALGFAKLSRKFEDTVRASDCDDETDEMDNWNPMAEDYLSHRNSYMVDVDDPGVAAVNYKAQDERRICKFYNSRRSHCWRGSDCPFEHVAYKGVVTTTDRREVFSFCEDELQLELPSTDSWIIVNITCVIDPSHFFVVLPFGNKSISDMVTDVRRPAQSSQYDEGYYDQAHSSMPGQKDSLDYLMGCLQDCYKSKVYVDTDLIVYTDGEIVVVRFTQDERWHRAKIITSDPDNNRVQVLYVDFGNKEWVTQERVRQIQKEFLYLPFQAVECRLPLCANNAGGQLWSDGAKQFFVESVKGKYLIAHVLQRSQERILYVNLYDTNSTTDLNINKSLIERGHARKSALPGLQSWTSYSSFRETDSVQTLQSQTILIPG